MRREVLHTFSTTRDSVVRRCDTRGMTDAESFERRDDAVRLAAIIDGLCENQEATAALEAENAVHLAAAMRIVLARMDGERTAKQTREMEHRSVAAEIGLALRWSDRTVQRARKSKRRKPSR